MAGEKPSVTFAKGNAPEDKWNIVKIFAFFSGFAVLFPSSAIIASTDFYEDVYGDDSERLLFYVSFAITITSPFVQLLLQRVQNKISYTSRIMVALFANTVLAGIFPFVVLFLSSKVSYYLVILISFCIGLNNAVLKLSFFSLISYYPAKYNQDIVFGKGLSPLLVVLLKMGIKAISEHYYPNDLSFAVRRGTVVFFILAALVPLICAMLYRLARKTSLFSKHFFPSFRVRKLILAGQHHVEEESSDDIHASMAALTSNTDQEQLHFDQESSDNSDDDDDVEGGEIIDGTMARKKKNLGSVPTKDSFSNVTQEDLITTPLLPDINVIGAANGDYVPLDDDDDNASAASPYDPNALSIVGRTQSSFDPTPEFVEPKVNSFRVLKKISLPAFVLALTMFITYTAYPTIMLKSPPVSINMSKGWWKLLLLFVFAIADFITRSLPYDWLLSICAVSKIDLFAYCRIIFIPIYVYSVYINTIASQLLIVATILLGITNGVVFVITMRNYSHLVKDHERSTAGSFMSISVVAGVLIANLFALLIDAMGK